MLTSTEPIPSSICSPSCSGLHWTVSSSNEVFIQSSVVRSYDNTHLYHFQHSCIETATLLGIAHEEDGPLGRVWDCAFHRTEFTWKTELARDENGIVQDSVKMIVKIRQEDERRELRLLSQVGDFCGLRLDPSFGWRMLSPNACLHFQFGPGVTVATDGVRVLVFSFPRFSTDFMLCHRTNILGPVTSTPIRTASWDYHLNKPRRSEPKEKKPSALLSAALLALLE